MTKLTLTADSIHLKQCVTLYLFALPFTLVEELGWGTIPIVTVVAFTFMGIEGIADEIEMPFGPSLSLVWLSCLRANGCPGNRFGRVGLATGPLLPGFEGGGPVSHMSLFSPQSASDGRVSIAI